MPPFGGILGAKCPRLDDAGDLITRYNFPSDSDKPENTMYLEKRNEQLSL